MIIGTTIKIILILTLSSFMAATMISFLRVRLSQKETKYKNTLHVLGVDEGLDSFSATAFRDEYSFKDYLLPVSFTTFICLVGFIHLFFGFDLLTLSEKNPVMLFTGILFDDLDNLPYIERKNLVVMVMAFMGAFIWSAKNIIRRLITLDLVPGTYYSAGFRMIFATFIALMMSFSIEGVPDSDISKNMLPVVAFLAGMFPDRALDYVKTRSRIFAARKNSEKAHALPLYMIEGINSLHKSRLSETGIDNVQNLAEANLIELLLHTSFSVRILIDWIAQARLCVYLKDDFNKLDKVGIRTAFDFINAVKTNEQITKIAKTTGIPELILKVVYQRLKDDTGTKKLFEYQDTLSK